MEGQLLFFREQIWVKIPVGPHWFHRLTLGQFQFFFSVKEMEVILGLKGRLIKTLSPFCFIFVSWRISIIGSAVASSNS